MGRIEVDLFTSLDLVAQAPGGRDEDPEGGFRFGGWQAPFSDDVIGEQIVAGIMSMDALLLGRKTYTMFADYWPKQADDFAGGIAGKLNSIPKYVASHKPVELTWPDSHQLGTDVPAAVREVRDRHENVHVIGSLDFLQTLLSESLFDRLNLFVYPITLGPGKKIFASGAIPSRLKLAEPALSTSTGTVLLRYDFVGGEPETGQMG